MAAKAAAANRERGLQQALRAEGFAPEMVLRRSAVKRSTQQYINDRGWTGCGCGLRCATREAAGAAGVTGVTGFTG